MIRITRIQIAIFTLTSLLALTIAFSAACGSTSQFETIQTFESEKKVEQATSTAAAVIAAGGNPDEIGVQVGVGSIAAQAQATAAAKATAAAESGEDQSGDSAVGTDAGSESEQTADFEVEVPDGPALSGEATVSMEDTDQFEPQIIKITVGTTVTWENPRGSPSSATSLEGEAEEFDTGELWKSSFNREKCCGSHTFTVLGCHRYRSQFSGDTAEGAVCVVEE